MHGGKKWPEKKSSIRAIRVLKAEEMLEDEERRRRSQERSRWWWLKKGA